MNHNKKGITKFVFSIFGISITVPTIILLAFLYTILRWIAIAYTNIVNSGDSGTFFPLVFLSSLYLAVPAAIFMVNILCITLSSLSLAIKPNSNQNNAVNKLCRVSLPIAIVGIVVSALIFIGAFIILAIVANNYSIPIM